MNQKTDRFFFDSWSESREAFISAIKNLGGTFESIRLDQKSPDGQDLSIGIGIIQCGSSQTEASPDLLIHISGVHGVEGFAGSAAQLKILKDLFHLKASDRWSDLPSRRLAFVHSVNPFGMSWYRRNNANNVDLNRNTLTSNGEFPKSIAYPVIHSILLDQSWLKYLWPFRLGYLQVRQGKQFLMQGLSGGQYQFADGFFYGGQSWQNELRLLSVYLEQKFSAVQRVFTLDIHTGLGPYAHEVLFSAEGAHEAEVADMKKRLEVDLSADKIKGAATYKSSGSFSNLIYRAFRGARIRYILQEFGTFNGFSVLRGLRAEQRAWLRGEFGPGHRPSEHLKRLFYPEDSYWRTKALEDSSRLFFKVLHRGFD